MTCHLTTTLIEWANRKLNVNSVIGHGTVSTESGVIMCGNV